MRYLKLLFLLLPGFSFYGINEEVQLIYFLEKSHRDFMLLEVSY